MLLVKKSLLFLGTYILICSIACFFDTWAWSDFETNGRSTLFVSVTVLLITVLVLVACFLTGRFLGKNAAEVRLNFLSSLSILFAIIISILIAMIIKNPYMFNGMFKFFAAPNFWIALMLSSIFKINQEICFISFTFLPYIVFTIGAVTNKHKQKREKLKEN
jgi:hypothetical protein